MNYEFAQTIADFKVDINLLCEFSTLNFRSFLWWYLGQFLVKSICFMLDQEAKVLLILDDLVELCSLKQILNHYISFIPKLCLNVFSLKNCNFWEICVMTKVCLTSLKVDLLTNHALFWNWTSISNLLLLSIVFFV